MKYLQLIFVKIKKYEFINKNFENQNILIKYKYTISEYFMYIYILIMGLIIQNCMINLINLYCKNNFSQIIRTYD